MAIQVTWRSAPDQPYEITASAGTADHEEKLVPAGGEEFSRFRELAATLVRVPKAELDEARGKS